MSLWTNQQPPELYPNAVATDAGWADPVTGELYVAITGLSTFKGGTAGLVNLGIYNDKSRYTTSKHLGNTMVYGYNDYIVLEAVFSEPVTWSGGPPSIAGTINTTPVTFAYFEDTTDLLADTVGKVMSVTIGTAGSHYQVGDLLTFTGGGGTQVFPTDADLSGVYDDLPGIAKGYVSAVNGSGGITGIVLTNNGASYASPPTVGVSTGHVVSVTVTGTGTGYLQGDTLIFSGGGATKNASGYIVVDANGNVTSAVVTNPGAGYTSVGTLALGTSHGSGNDFAVNVSYGSSASLTAVLGTVANGKGTNRILFRYQVASTLAATSGQITLTSPIGGGATWTTVDSSSGSDAAASAVVSSGVTSYTMSNHGSSYNTPPLVTITSLTGTGATAVAVLDQGVNTVTPGTAGVGYRTAQLPISVTQSGGGSTNATITPVLGTTGVVCDVNPGGSLGSGTYTNGAAITVSGGTGTGGFAGTIVVNGGGDITGVVITNPGSYSVEPTLVAPTGTGLGTGRTLQAILGFPIVSYTVAGTNTGYTAAPALTVAPPTAKNAGTSWGAGVNTNVTATATATIQTLTATTVASVQPVTEGTGYADAAVLFNNTGTGGSGAIAAAVHSGEISSFVVTNQGSGYYLAPTVSIGSGAGSGAEATATIDDRGHVIAVTTNSYVSGITVTGTSNNQYVNGEPLLIGGNATGHISVTNTVSTNPTNGVETITSQSVAAVVDNAGSGYLSVPIVSYPTPGRGSGLTFTAAITGMSGGTGYVATLPTSPATPIYTAQTVTFTPVAETPAVTFNSNQYVSGVTVSSTGTGYVTGQSLVFSGGTAVGTILVNDSGNITGVVISNGGSYATAPTITVAAPPSWSGTYNGYVVGQIVLYSGVRYKALISSPTNFNKEPDNYHTGPNPFWLALTDNTLTAVMGSSIVGCCTVDGVVPTITAANVTYDRFGDAITQTTFNTGDFFTVSFTCSKPVFVVGNGATVPLSMTSCASICDVTIGGTADTTAVAGSITVDNSGTGGTNFAATAIVVNGDIVGVVITNAGSGYTSAPTLTLTGMTNRTLTAVIGVNATFFGGSSTAVSTGGDYAKVVGYTTLRFAYQIASTDSSAPTTFSVASPIYLAYGTTIEDAAGNPLTLTFTPPTTTGITIN